MVVSFHPNTYLMYIVYIYINENITCYFDILKKGWNFVNKGRWLGTTTLTIILTLPHRTLLQLSHELTDILTSHTHTHTDDTQCKIFAKDVNRFLKYLYSLWEKSSCSYAICTTHPHTNIYIYESVPIHLFYVRLFNIYP